jgi:hypothetical protein
LTAVEIVKIYAVGRLVETTGYVEAVRYQAKVIVAEAVFRTIEAEAALPSMELPAVVEAVKVSTPKKA